MIAKPQPQLSSCFEFFQNILTILAKVICWDEPFSTTEYGLHSDIQAFLTTSTID